MSEENREDIREDLSGYGNFPVLQFREWLCRARGYQQKAAQNAGTFVKRIALLMREKGGWDYVMDSPSKVEAASDEVRAEFGKHPETKDYVLDKVEPMLRLVAGFADEVGFIRSKHTNVLEELRYDLPEQGFRFIDLFAGIGGFHQAMASLGGKCVMAAEKDETVAKTYEKNYGIPALRDVTKIELDDVPEHDVICGGFPCQSFSIAGRRKGFQDPRGNLFFSVSNIALAKRPYVLFLENVKNFASHDKGKTLETVRDTLDGMGYNVSCKVLNSADYGAATARQRIYIVAVRKDLGVTYEFPKPLKGGTRPVKDFLLPNEEVSKFWISEERDFVYHYSEDGEKKETFDPSHPGIVAMEKTGGIKPIRLGHKYDDTPTSSGQGNRVYSIEGPAITFSSGGGGLGGKTGLYLVEKDGKRCVRRLSPKEAVRIMGFPENFWLPDNVGDAYHQIGNSVQVDMIKAIAKGIVEIIETKVRGRSASA